MNHDKPQSSPSQREAIRRLLRLVAEQIVRRLQSEQELVDTQREHTARFEDQRKSRRKRD